MFWSVLIAIVLIQLFIRHCEEQTIAKINSRSYKQLNSNSLTGNDIYYHGNSSITIFLNYNN